MNLQKIYDKLYRLPCWNAHQSGYGSCLTFEFGVPHLKIREQIPGKTHPQLGFKREVWLRGDWHLWINCCDWVVFLNGKDIANSNSKDVRIQIAMARLNGQALVKIVIDPKTGDSTFIFDQGGTIQTKRWKGKTLWEQWHLSKPSGYILTVRSDGKYSYMPGRTKPKHLKWIKIQGNRTRV